ncbi:MAG TPA: tetratricopeptide repeat protein [Candidatus Limnocylindrales bacterium]|nr:tetratricopeptide repeat protein [Candidatus Limnocylindrales bacterium]
MKKPATLRAVPVTVQAVPPAIAASSIERARLERRLDEALGRRLTILVADAGAGKSTLLAGWAARGDAAWYTCAESDADLTHLATGLLDALALRVPALPAATAGLIERTLGPEATGDERARARACAALIADALASTLTRELGLVLDDVQELGRGGPGAWLVEALGRQAPPRLHLVLSSRDPLPFSIERLRGQGQAVVLGGSVLAFDRDEIATLLRQGLGAADDAVVDELVRVTHGWPAAVRLAMEALVDVRPDERPSAARRLLRSTGPIYTYLAEEVIGRAGSEVRTLLEAVVALPRFNGELCAALGVVDADAAIRSLETRGLFIQPLGDGRWFTLHPLLRAHLLGRGADGPDGAATTALAARWFQEHELYRDAVACWTALGDMPAVAGVLERHGAELLSAGDVDTVADAAAGLPPELRTPAIERVDGQAHQIRGDWTGALRCFRAIAPADAEIEPGVAWRMGLIYHLRGELDEALATYHRGRRDADAALADTSLLESWTAAAHWLRGDLRACRPLAARALEDAEASGDDHALAGAYTIAAMVAALDGDRRANDAHYLRALDHASRSGDVLQAIRIRANRGSRLVEEGYYEEALDELRGAISLAEVTGFAAFHALALSNRGDALARLGRLDDAIADLEASRQLYQKLESRLVSYPLGHLGDVHLERGAPAVARGAYEEAIAIADRVGDVQGLRPALAGLAEILAVDEPERARALAERAVTFGPGIGLVRSYLARGRVALAAGRLDVAQAAALDAAAEARSRRDRAGLAEALELEAMAARDPAAARALLGEALLIWRDLGCPLAAARVELELSGLDPGRAGDEHERTLRAAGAAPPRLPWGRRAGADERSATGAEAIRVSTFGGFEVIRDGRAVTTAGWGSKKARDLFKILVTRRGAHVLREQLEELLWPEGAGRPSRRLSVALSTVRSVLDPDHRHAAGHFVAADRDAAWLEVGRLAIDVEEFLADAGTGLALAAAGDASAVEPLRAAEAAHRGEFLVEDAFEDWSAGLREECRQTYISVGHALAAFATAEGDHAAAARYLRRVLAYDDYDERAHLDLVAALAVGGHPADARRAYGAYLARMEELGVEAAPFPD